MIEIPEAAALSVQITENCAGKKITGITAGTWPHKLVWFYGERDRFPDLVVGRTGRGAQAVGGMVEISVDGSCLLFSEGVNLRYLPPESTLPAKRQLDVTFFDGTVLVAWVQMYGGLGAFKKGANDNPYYRMAQQKPSPLESRFDPLYFGGLLAESGAGKLSAKGFLATEQRIPGLGNGVLQDILYRAGINPRRKMSEVTEERRERLFRTLKETLRDMFDGRGRDTERDLFGKPGRYRTLMSRHTVGTPCPACGHPIQKAAYMGGAVYYCPECQP